MERIGRYRALLWLLCLGGCVTGINENVVRLQTLPAFDQYEKLRKVAIIPFGEYIVTRNEKVVMGVPHKITKDNGKIMSDVIADELKKQATFIVIPPDKIATFFKRRGEKVWGLLTPKEVSRVGALLKADALVVGQVREMSIYKYRMHENSRVIADIRMVDSVTAELVWKGSIKMDEEGLPHEVARRGMRQLLEQLKGKLEVLDQKKAQPLSIIDR
ncbi:MAG: hypothetical protein NTZ78_13890 [Candidatus Aureabacteria bacterium]|nr:hypothetical protein [Candidatus Auribacterota bacterium]